MIDITELEKDPFYLNKESFDLLKLLKEIINTLSTNQDCKRISQKCYQDWRLKVLSTLMIIHGMMEMDIRMLGPH